MFVLLSFGFRSEKIGFGTSSPLRFAMVVEVSAVVYRSTGYRKSIPKRRFWSKQRRLIGSSASLSGGRRQAESEELARGCAQALAEVVAESLA